MSTGVDAFFLSRMRVMDACFEGISALSLQYHGQPQLVEQLCQSRNEVLKWWMEVNQIFYASQCHEMTSIRMKKRGGGLNLF